MDFGSKQCFVDLSSPILLQMHIKKKKKTHLVICMYVYDAIKFTLQYMILETLVLIFVLHCIMLGF